MLFLFILLKVCMISCQSNNDPQPPVTAPCYVGTWGNDYTTCPLSYSATQGVGALASRQAQELKLVLNADSTGTFHFYDCSNSRYATAKVYFKYRVANDKISFDWQGETTDIIKAIRDGFDGQTTYQMQCKGDSLLFPENMFRIDYRYHNTHYFLKR